MLGYSEGYLRGSTEFDEDIYVSGLKVGVKYSKEMGKIIGKVE